MSAEILIGLCGTVTHAVLLTPERHVSEYSYARPRDNNDDGVLLQRAGVRAVLDGGIHHDFGLLDERKCCWAHQGAQVS